MAKTCGGLRCGIQQACACEAGMLENRHTLGNGRKGMFSNPALNSGKHGFTLCGTAYLNSCGENHTRCHLITTLWNQATRVVEASWEEHTHGWQSCSKVAVRNIEERTDAVKSRVRKR